MRQADRDRLEQPFPENDPRSGTEQLSAALDVKAPSTASLAKCVLDDLDTEKYGVGWWVGHVATKRRILISDQLQLAVATIETNLVEARLHLLEAMDYFEQSSRDSNLTVIEGPTGEAHKLKKPLNAAAHLPHELAKLHMVGFFRAVGSALDCLGTGVIGILALPANLLRGDLKEAQKKLAKVDAAKGDGAKLQADFGQFLADVEKNSGPEGWLQWALDYRNLLVHRGRHLSPWMQRKTGVKLWVANEARKVALDSILLLSREPGRGEVDALRGFKQGHVLTEDAQTTLSGLYESASTFIEKTCARLIEVWRVRRDQPGLLVQPDAQWPDTDLPDQKVFLGYAPNKVEFNPKQMVVSTSFGKRLQAAALDGDLAGRWSKFD